MFISTVHCKCCETALADSACHGLPALADLVTGDCCIFIEQQSNSCRLHSCSLVIPTACAHVNVRKDMLHILSTLVWHSASSLFMYGFI